ncbi:MAG: hypothetical protein ABWY47_02495, partial [Xanthobacteraceae bacterium]
MPRTYLVFGDIEGKLDVLRVECTKCDRKGRYHVHKLIEKHGRMGNLMKWREMLNADYPRRDARINGPLRPGVPGSFRRCFGELSELPWDRKKSPGFGPGLKKTKRWP